jgi:hypothetical protein
MVSDDEIYFCSVHPNTAVELKTKNNNERKKKKRKKKKESRLSSMVINFNG